MTANSITWNSIRADVLADPAIKAEYDALETEFNIASQLIALRAATGLTQREFAERVGMKQSQLARIESGKQIPKLETLAKLAAGAGYMIEIHLIPLTGKQQSKIKPLRIALPEMKSEMAPLPVSFVTAFLESDDSVAVRIRERLGEREAFALAKRNEVQHDQRSEVKLSRRESPLEFAAELNKCLSIPEEKDRIIAVKNALASSIRSRGTTRSVIDENDEIELLYLAESLLAKLAEIKFN